MTNSLLQPSTLDFALPDYAHLTDDDYREAALQGMTEQLVALEALAADPTAPTVENTLHAWETSGETLERAVSAFWVAKSADTNPRRDEILAELSPALAAHNDAIWMNRALYNRFVALRDSGIELDEQDSHALAEILRRFERAGVQLDESTQARLREINTRLATLSTDFTRALVAGRNAAAVLVTDEEDLAGLDADARDAAAEAARETGQQGWLLTITNTSGQPVLDTLENRELRRRIYEASVSRGLAGEHDTRQLIIETVQLRAERAALLGFEHHAAYVAADGCAKTTDNVTAILQRLAPGVLEIARLEARDLEQRLAADVPAAALEPWDWQYYAAHAAAEQAVDHDALKPYFEYQRVLSDGVFAAATALYGITFHERADLVGYTADATVYEVREEDGSVLGAVIIDPFTRSTKQGGAWMTSIVDQAHLTGLKPVVTNTCNFARPAAGAPSLLTWDNVITLFHEFGHDLHGLLSDVRYPSRAGTAVPRDFVEFPSQVNEIWAWNPQLLNRYARHHETGEPLPDELLQALIAGRRQGVGYEMLEILQAMLLDQAWHSTPADQLPTSPEQVEEFEAAALMQAGVAFAPIPPRYRSAYFSHIFAGGYSAGYYSYLWSEIMDADTVAWFDEQGGMTREAGEHFRRELLGRGGSIEAMTAYRRFRGAEPDVAHLLRRIGLDTSA